MGSREKFPILFRVIYLCRGDSFFVYFSLLLFWKVIIMARKEKQSECMNIARKEKQGECMNIAIGAYGLFY